MARESGALLRATLGDGYVTVTHFQRGKHMAIPAELEGAVGFAMDHLGYD